MSYDYRRRTDLLLLAEHVMSLEPLPLARLNAWLIGERIRRTYRWMELVVRFAAWWKGSSVEDRWLVVYASRHEINIDARNDLINHMLNGKNETDAASVGGFGEVDIARIATKLHDLEASMADPAAA